MGRLPVSIRNHAVTSRILRRPSSSSASLTALLLFSFFLFSSLLFCAVLSLCCLLNESYDVFVDESSGTVYATDFGGNRVVSFPDSRFLTGGSYSTVAGGTQGCAAGQLIQPKSIIFSAPYIYLSCSSSSLLRALLPPLMRAPLHPLHLFSFSFFVWSLPPLRCLLSVVCFVFVSVCLPSDRSHRRDERQRLGQLEGVRLELEQ